MKKSSHPPGFAYFLARDAAEIERETEDLKADIEDLKAEHRERYSTLQTLTDQHRRLELLDKKPSTKQLRSIIKAGCRQSRFGLDSVSERSSLLRSKSTETFT